MNCKEKGLATEKRVVSACSCRDEFTPSWFGRIRRASRKLDERGIDAIVVIRASRSRMTCVVPIQIKSSAVGKKWFLRRKILHKEARVPVVVVTEAMTPEEIRAHVYEEISAIRTFAVTFKPFLRTLISTDMITLSKGNWRRNRKARRRNERELAMAAE